MVVPQRETLFKYRDPGTEVHEASTNAAAHLAGPVIPLLHLHGAADEVHTSHRRPDREGESFTKSALKAT